MILEMAGAGRLVLWSSNKATRRASSMSTFLGVTAFMAARSSRAFASAAL